MQNVCLENNLLRLPKGRAASYFWVGNLNMVETSLSPNLPIHMLEVFITNDIVPFLHFFLFETDNGENISVT